MKENWKHAVKTREHLKQKIIKGGNEVQGLGIIYSLVRILST
jgi:hypothetical protein